MAKKITFAALTDKTLKLEPSPTPASNHAPKWFKKTLKYESVKGGTQSIVDFAKSNEYQQTFKMCQPFTDALTSGYTITLPATIIVIQESNSDGTFSPKIRWNTDWDIADVQHPMVASNLPKPEGYSPDVFRWVNNWKIETPAGYSCLFMHPVYRYDLPFHTLTGLVDTDKNPNPLLFPFFLKKDFEGEIPMGTPIVQVLPFKRDSWESETSISVLDGYGAMRVKQTFHRAYKQLYWSKKIFK